MKKTVYIMAIAALAYVLAFATGLGSVRQVAGEWLVNADGDTFFMALGQSGRDISGTWKPLGHGDGEIAIRGGVSGDAIKFKLESPRAKGFEAAREYEGRVLDVGGILKMEGAFLHPGGGSAAWCATPLHSVAAKDLEEWCDCGLPPPSP